MGRNQREYVLRQQLKAIKEELGEIDEAGGDLDEFEEKIEKAKMPPEAEKVAHQAARAAQGDAAVVGRVHGHAHLPRVARRAAVVDATEDKLDIEDAREILDADHYDLEKVKKRILEYLAVRKLKSDKKGPILCLVGPPGVGKTSLGQSIARALGRKFVRISLGGVRDEAEIRGHRRTYVGALPGRIIQGMKKAGTNNPVFMLDEIDKLGARLPRRPGGGAARGARPRAEPHASRDHYLEVPFDLSKVMFIATANILDPIPPALRDRMEVLELPGYTREEKLQHRAAVTWCPSSSRSTASTTSSVDVRPTRRSPRSSTATRARRACATSSARSRTSCRARRGARWPRARPSEQTRHAASASPEYPRARRSTCSEVAERTEEPGVATGLAWTPVGGDILFIEATQDAGKGKLVLTGQLGDVMKESAQAALSFIRAQGQVAGHRRELPREDRHPRPRPGGRHPEGRPVGGRDDVHGAGLAADRQAGAQRRGDDRRDHAARRWCCRSAASRRRSWPRTAPASSGSSCPSATART